VFAGPTLGYLVGFPIGAFVIGLVASRFRHRMSFPAALAGAVVGGIGVVTVCGIFGMSAMMGVSLVEATGFALPFLPGDLIKAVLAAAITAALWKARPALARTS
ncbi:BioY family transporter, partial [Thioclava sp. BHET1]